MALENIESGSPPEGREEARVLKELQGLTCTVIAGAGAATPIALAGIGTDDTIVAALLYKDPGAASAVSVVKLTPTIPSAGNVQFAEATNAAANDRVVVWWFNKGAL